MFDIEHRCRKARTRNGSEQVMHSDKAIDVAMRVDGGPSRAQLMQRARPQSSKIQASLRRKYAPELGEYGIGVSPLQHEITDDLINAPSRQR